jgi:hypothetical protein
MRQATHFGGRGRGKQPLAAFLVGLLQFAQRQLAVFVRISPVDNVQRQLGRIDPPVTIRVELLEVLFDRHAMFGAAVKWDAARLPRRWRIVIIGLRSRSTPRCRRIGRLRGVICRRNGVG